LTERRLGTPASCPTTTGAMPNSLTFSPALAAKAVAAVVLALLAAGLISAPADARAVIGVGESSYMMFYDQRFQRLGVRTVRIVLPYDYQSSRFDTARYEPYLMLARAQHKDVLVHFGHSNRPRRLHQLPSVRAYRRAVAAFAKAHPWVISYGVWNEATHNSQPTYRTPRRAAQYAKALHRAVPAAKHIVVLDGLDGRRLAGYTRAFRRVYRLRSRKDVWGLHNYDDANVSHTPRYTRAYLHLVPGKVWITETGGIIRSKHRHYGVRAAAKATRVALRIAKTSRRVRRVYLYQWIRNPRNHWDSAFISAKGTPRPAYWIFKNAF
jgi:hypothetical protein